MGLQDDIDEIVAAGFVDSDAIMGTESFTYCPDSGPDAAINGQVWRHAPTTDSRGLPMKKTVISVTVSDVPKLTVGKDRVRIAWPNRNSAQIQTLLVTALESEDAGMYRLILG